MTTNISIFIFFIALLVFVFFINKFIVDRKYKEVTDKNKLLETQLNLLQSATEKLLQEFERIVHENNRLRIQIEKLNTDLEIFAEQIKMGK